MTINLATKALIGLAVGDAFGAAFEYSKGAPEYAELSFKEKRYLDAHKDCKAKPNRGRLPGLYTDDTQQALALLKAWDRCDDPLDAEEVSVYFRDILQMMTEAKVHRGTGRNFRTAMATGEPVDTAGMGAAMRIGPVATLLPSPDLIAPWVIEVSSCTTSNDIALTAAVQFAYACWFTAHGQSPKGTLGRGGIDDVAWTIFTKAQHVMRDKGEVALLEFAEGTELANKKMSCAANGFALTGIPWVMYHAYTATSFKAGLLDVCSSGGDTDTVAAMAGCLMALRKKKIPKWMLNNIRGSSHLADWSLWDPVVSEALLTREEKSHKGKA